MYAYEFRQRSAEGGVSHRVREKAFRSTILRQVVYWRSAVGLARFLGLSKLMKRMYWKLTCPADGIYNAECSGIEARFYVRTAGEWRKMEGTYGTGAVEVFMEVLAGYLRPEMVFYDIGSNIGEYAVFAGNSVGPRGLVVAFEPEINSYARLKTHVELNRLTNVRAYNIALGDVPGSMPLRVAGFLGRQSKLTGTEPEQGARVQVVDVASGDGIRDTERLPVPNAVKIDVEGYEFQVLAGLKKTLQDPTCELLCCEVHPMSLPAPLRPEDLEAAIKDIGFSRVEVIHRGSELHFICTKSGQGCAAI